MCLPGAAIIGLKLSALTPDLRKKYGLDAKIKGVVVEAVDPQSPAKQKGLKPGDVIVEAAQEAVTEPDDVAASIDKVEEIRPESRAASRRGRQRRSTFRRRTILVMRAVR